MRGNHSRLIRPGPPRRCTAPLAGMPNRSRHPDPECAADPVRSPPPELPRRTPAPGMILLRALVAAHDVIIEHGFHIPALLLRHLREVPAAVQPLLLSRDGKKDNRARKFQFAQHARAFQADGRSAAIVIRPGRIAIHVEACRCCANRNAPSPARCASHSPRSVPFRTA